MVGGIGGSAVVVVGGSAVVVVGGSGGSGVGATVVVELLISSSYVGGL